MRIPSLLLSLSIFLGASLFIHSSPLAQSLTDPWSEPLNLSHSGAASNPIMAVDAEGTAHVFWTDEFDGSMYARREGGEWSDPIQVSVPFEGFTPLLLADSQGYLHAFWNDEEQALRYANVLISTIPDSAWNPAVVITGSAAALDVEIDAQDRLHLAYVRVVNTAETPAGIYYRQSVPGGGGWNSPLQLYQSLYFRTLSPDQAQVDVEITDPGDSQRIFITWDNRPRSRVYLVKSQDGGVTWAEPVEIDKPELSGESAIPSNLTVYARNDEVLLVWQTGSQSTGCSQYYQQSEDGGETWQPPQRFSDVSFGCAKRFYFLTSRDDPVLFLDSPQVYLQTWDGDRWSDPRMQSSMTSLIDPETQQTVNLACLNPALSGDELFVVGCTTGVGGDDIWWLERDLSDLAEWFPQESVWQPLNSVTRGGFTSLSLSLVVDSQERLHGMWSQRADGSTLSPDSALYYSRWEGDRQWSQPVAILSSPEELAVQPTLALDSAGRLLLVWRRGDQGEIVFNHAAANQAVLSSAWSEPIRVSNPDQISSAPDIVVSDQGAIYIVYAVPVNEGRGIYLTRSEDSGDTWSEPIQVFDGASADWAMLDQPHLALTSNGDLHLLWTYYDLRSGGAEPVALSYTRSQDGGETWAEPDIVVENPEAWSRVLSTADGSVHRFWQEVAAGGRTILGHERSLDSGATWERIAQISTFGQAVGNPSLIGDRAGGLHLLQVANRGAGDYVLQHWIWNGERWGGSDSLNLDLEEGASIGDTASAVSPQGNLGMIFSVQSDGPGPRSGSQGELFFTARSIELPEGLPTPLPQVAETPTVIEEQPTQAPTAPPTLTPTPDLSAPGPAGNTGDSWDELVIGPILAGIVVAIAFGFGFWKVRGGGNNRG